MVLKGTILYLTERATLRGPTLQFSFFYIFASIEL